ncbi:MAG: peptidylprolyl isomerase [Armatimonas sp.]
MALTPGLIMAALLFAPPGNSIPAKPPTPKSAAAPKLPANVVARVGGKDITRAELMDALAAVGVRDAVMQWLNQKVVLEKESKRLGVTVSDAEVRKKLEEEKVKVVQNAIRQMGEPMTFSQVQQRFGVTLGEMEWRIRLNLLATKTYDKYLETQVPSLKGQRKLAHILIATISLNGGAPPMTPEEAKTREEEAKKKIDGIQADIQAGKITFEKAAQQFSDDKGPDGRGSASQGGGMPFAGKGVFDPDFEKAAWSLAKAGDITPPVKSRFGWHLIKLISKGEEATPAELAAYRKEYLALAKADPRQFPQWLNNLIRSQSLTFNTEFQLVEKKPAAATKTAQKPK